MKFECWIIKLRNAEQFYAAKHERGEFFNTFKFESYAALVAYARSRNLHPIDYIACRAEFEMPTILEQKEIDYGMVEISLADIQK